MNEQVTIYALCDEGGAARYVGQTRQDLARRLLGHHNEARRGTSAKDRWFRAALAAGQMPAIRALEVTTNEEADEREKRWIDRLRQDGQALLNDRSRRRAHGRHRRKAPTLAWSHMASLPAQWQPRVRYLAAENGVATAVMLRLLVHAGLERWEAWMDLRAAKQELP